MKNRRKPIWYCPKCGMGFWLDKVVHTKRKLAACLRTHVKFCKGSIIEQNSSITDSHGVHHVKRAWLISGGKLYGTKVY